MVSTGFEIIPKRRVRLEPTLPCFLRHIAILNHDLRHGLVAASAEDFFVRKLFFPSISDPHELELGVLNSY